MRKALLALTLCLLPSVAAADTIVWYPTGPVIIVSRNTFMLSEYSLYNEHVKERADYREAARERIREARERRSAARAVAFTRGFVWGN